ncbi:MAG TPA: dihydrolipoyl dehydrogenase [Tissierellia bacterium]|nr:dihydrolipoyl dehydrogenase [Tissierellia bacterium]
MEDLIIIGGGPAGYAAALRATQLGLSTILVEKDRAGGTCLNRGCIPTKALIKSALLYEQMADLASYGITTGDVTLDFSVVQERKAQVTENLVKGIETLLEKRGVTVVKGTATFLDSQRVEVMTQEGAEVLEAKNIMIATGSKPFDPPIPGMELPGVIGSDEILNIDHVPKRLFVSGASVIGLEFASIFRAFGSEVHVSGRTFLKREDGEIQRRLQNLLKRKGIKFHLGGRLQRIEKREDGLEVYFEGKKGEESVIVDTVLMSAGRVANFDGLDLKAAGVEFDNQGIRVNEFLETSAPGVYAAGDVIGGEMLAHVATHEALYIVSRIAGAEGPIEYRAIPACSFTIPELASVGMTEEEVKAEGLPYKSAKFPFIAASKAQCDGVTDGFVKVLTSEEGKILGVHILGAGASELISEATLAIAHDMSAEDLFNTIHAHPTLPEALSEATMATQGLAIHQL